MKRHIITYLMIVMLATMTCYGRKVNSRRADSDIARSETVAEAVDAVGNQDSLVVISGYDKPLRSSKETLFATNRSDRALQRMALTIAYYDTQGRLIHKRSCMLPARIPAGESRQLSFSSWDIQQSFYYLNSRKPKVSGAVPYDIAVKVDTLFFALPKH